MGFRTTRRTVIFRILTLLILTSACSIFSGPAGTSAEEPVSEEPAPADVPEAGEGEDEPEPEDEGFEGRGADVEAWRQPVAIALYISKTCQETVDQLDSLAAGGVDQKTAYDEIFLYSIFLDSAEAGLDAWEADELAGYRDQLRDSLSAMETVLLGLQEEKIDPDQALTDLRPVCAAAQETFSGIQYAALKAGVPREDLDGLLDELNEGMEDFFSEVYPPEQPETGGDSEVGKTLSSPYPVGSLQEVPNWEIQIVDTERGEPVWELLAAENEYNVPPPEGMEYIMVKVHARSLYEDGAEHHISGIDFAMTGSRLHLYLNTRVAAPEPALDAGLLPGEEAEGWITFLVREDEDNLVLIFVECESWEEGRERFFSVEETAVIKIPEGLDSIEPDEQGISWTDPVPYGSEVVTDDWKLQVMDVVRGEEAWQSMVEWEPASNAPGDNFEYLLVYIRAGNIVPEMSFYPIDATYFSVIGDLNERYYDPYLRAPAPALEGYVLPGGVVEGWIVYVVQKADTNLLLAYDPYTNLVESFRYLSLGF